MKHSYCWQMGIFSLRRQSTERTAIQYITGAPSLSVFRHGLKIFLFERIGNGACSFDLGHQWIPSNGPSPLPLGCMAL